MSHIDDLLGRFTFRHQSPSFHRVLRPLQYRELIRTREDIKYVEDRKAEEQQYRRLLRSQPDQSFLYATIVGFHRMESPRSYPGYTYYFKLDAAGVDACLFTVVDRGANAMPALRGLPGMLRALRFWLRHRDTMQATEDELLGSIDPRIEVVTQQRVRWIKMVPQIEDR